MRTALKCKAGPAIRTPHWVEAIPPAALNHSPFVAPLVNWSLSCLARGVVGSEQSTPSQLGSHLSKKLKFPVFSFPCVLSLFPVFL